MVQTVFIYGEVEGRYYSSLTPKPHWLMLAILKQYREKTGAVNPIHRPGDHP
jgi:hypothetical protein